MILINYIISVLRNSRKYKYIIMLSEKGISTIRLTNHSSVPLSYWSCYFSLILAVLLWQTSLSCQNELEMQVHDHYYGYWYPGAKAPSHQYPQCWLKYYLITDHALFFVFSVLLLWWTSRSRGPPRSADLNNVWWSLQPIRTFIEAGGPREKSGPGGRQQACAKLTRARAWRIYAVSIKCRCVILYQKLR